MTSINTGNATPADPAAGGSVKLSVIVPLMDDTKRLEDLLTSLHEALGEFKDGRWEVIVADEGGSRGAWELMLELKARPQFAGLQLVQYKKTTEIDSATRAALRLSRGEWIVTISADMSDRPRAIAEMTGILRQEPGVGLVIASACMPGGDIRGLSFRNLLFYHVGNRLLDVINKNRGRQKLYTVASPFRAFRRQVLECLDLAHADGGIHQEILAKATALGYRIKEIPVTKFAPSDSARKLFPAGESLLPQLLNERLFKAMGLLGLLVLCGGAVGLYYIVTVYLYHLMDPVHYYALEPNRPLMLGSVLLVLSGLQLICTAILGLPLVKILRRISQS